MAIPILIAVNKATIRRKRLFASIMENKVIRWENVIGFMASLQGSSLPNQSLLTLLQTKPLEKQLKKKKIWISYLLKRRELLKLNMISS